MRVRAARDRRGLRPGGCPAGGGELSVWPYNRDVAVETQIPELHRWSLEEYHQLIESGGFDDNARVELIDGLLVDMSPRTREHENALAWLDHVLQVSLDYERFQIRTAMALTLETSEPEPDLAVVDAAAPRPYYPGTAALVIEV